MEKQTMKQHQHSYPKLFLTLSISFLIMYAVMFLNVDSSNHIYISLTRAYMSLLMVSPMAVLMLLMMPAMYPKKSLNFKIAFAFTVVFVGALWMLRAQTAVGDIQYMKAMIPHHSSAIMTSKAAHIEDPEVKQLSRSIIESQQREIAQMKAMIERLEN